MQISVETPPLETGLTEELIDFWDEIFGDGYQADRSVYAGDERDFNRDTFYFIEQGGRTVGSSHLTTAVGNPELSGLGEVATVPQCRGQGIASRLCRAARDDFLAAGGQALFLGTVNPTAARIYHRLDWRKMAGSTVWALIASGESPESFLVDYFRASDEVGTEPGSPA
ncbi:MAG: GNAT family N-acetyltransferase, partial [Gemmatimonadota bacterium]|nr:GNAT family N-acetyltransferase [Gemmatimonadota bacterium]